MKKEFTFVRRVKRLILITFASTAFITLHGQLPEGSRKGKDIKHALCHTWNLNYKVGFTTDLEEPTESLSTIDFLDNGSLIIKTTSSKVASWSYDKKSHLLILDLKGQTESFKILKLTNKELLLQASDNTERQIRYWRND
jgi:hypothetical protein